MGQGAAEMIFSVQVDRSELAAALRTLSKFIKRDQAAEAVISLVDSALQIDLPGGAVGVAADGQWEGEVRAPGSFIVRLAKALPPSDPMPIHVDQDRLHFASLSVLCTIQPARCSTIELPLDPSLIDILRVRLDHSDDEIEQAGLSPLVREAEQRRDSIVLQAHNSLRTLSVNRTDILDLVERSVRRGRER